MNIIVKNTHHRGRTIAKLALVFITGALSLLLVPKQVQASAANPASTYIVASNDFYAYVQVGENLDTSFTKQINGSGAGDVDAVITLSRPGAADQSCTITAAAITGVTTACSFDDQTATQTGVWKIHFNHGGNIDYYSWTLGVQTGTTDIPGRAWSSLYSMAQLSGAPPTGIDFAVWYQSEFGYLYRTEYFDYNGIQSLVQASGIGLVHSGGGCVPLYKSVNLSATNFATPPASCDSDFKLFYEAPASDLPTSATQWDATTDWVKPAIATPVISDLSFNSTTLNSRDGDITFNLANYAGLVNVYIDTNNNGNYSDPVDVTIPYGANDGANTVPFDGKDGNGNTIPNSQALSFKANIDRSAEIHFLMQDVELSGGGIEVQRLNGPAGNETLIYWDDTDFADPDSNRCSITPQPNGTAGVDSTGGVHTWSLSGCGAPNYGNFNNGINGSWGDARTIDEWAYVAINTFATYTLAGYTDPSTPTLPDTGQNSSLLLAVAGTLMLVPAMTLVVIKRQTN